MTLKGLDRLFLPKTTDMDTFVRRAGCEALVGLPIYIQCWGLVEGELMLVFSGLRVPNDGCTINTCAQDVVAALVPLQGEDGSFVLTKSSFKLSTSGPNSCKAVV